MSEADRVFSSLNGQGTQTKSTERRHILSTTRKPGPGGTTSRMVEVVHVRREGAEQAAAGDAQAAGWLQDFRARPAQSVPPEERPAKPPKAPPPVVHVMPMWAPSVQQAAQPAEQPAAAPDRVDDATPRRAKAKAATQRHFADPFAAGDDGTNCIRCGYLVEPAREKRGRLTCAACG